MMDPCNGVRAAKEAVCDVETKQERRPAVGDTPVDLLDRPDGYQPTGDALIDVMLMCERSIATRRKLADKRRETAEQAQRSAEDQQVEKMREEARDTFAQAMVSCAFSMAASGAQAVSGGLQIRAGALQCEGARVAANAAAGSRPGTAATEWFSGHSTRAMGHAKVWEAVGGSITAMGGGVSGALNMAIKNDQADAKELEHASARAGRSVAAAADSSREAKEIADKTMQRLEQLIEMEHQTKLALIQRA